MISWSNTDLFCSFWLFGSPILLKCCKASCYYWLSSIRTFLVNQSHYATKYQVLVQHLIPCSWIECCATAIITPRPRIMVADNVVSKIIQSTSITLWLWKIFWYYAIISGSKHQYGAFIYYKFRPNNIKVLIK